MSQEYSAGFISGSEHLYRYEIKQVLSLMEEGLSREQIREKVLKENRFHQKNYTTNVRLFNKVWRRISYLDEGLADFVRKGTGRDVDVVLLYTYLKAYRFLREFAYEVLLYQYEQGRTLLTPAEVVEFFERVEEQSPKVRRYTPDTKKKMQQVMIKAFVDAEWLYPLKGGWEIRPLPISQKLKEYIAQHPEHQMIADLALNGKW